MNPPARDSLVGVVQPRGTVGATDAAGDMISERASERYLGDKKIFAAKFGRTAAKFARAGAAGAFFDFSDFNVQTPPKKP